MLFDKKWYIFLKKNNFSELMVNFYYDVKKGMCPAGIEPTASGSGGLRSIQLSYGHI